MCNTVTCLGDVTLTLEPWTSWDFEFLYKCCCQHDWGALVGQTAIELLATWTIYIHAGVMDLLIDVLVRKMYERVCHLEINTSKPDNPHEEQCTWEVWPFLFPTGKLSLIIVNFYAFFTIVFFCSSPTLTWLLGMCEQRNDCLLAQTCRCLWFRTRMWSLLYCWRAGRSWLSSSNTLS